jgi:pyrrolidone-carboxylate peptidase
VDAAATTISIDVVATCSVNSKVQNVANMPKDGQRQSTRGHKLPVRYIHVPTSPQVEAAQHKLPNIEREATQEGLNAAVNDPSKLLPKFFRSMIMNLT